MQMTANSNDSRDGFIGFTPLKEVFHDVSRSLLDTRVNKAADSVVGEADKEVILPKLSI